MHTDLFIGGKYVASGRGERFADIEPATENQLAMVTAADRADVDRAVAAARDAADRGPWRRMNAEQRGKLLYRLADGIERRARELGTLEARDVGKPITECINHDVARAARNIRFFAAQAETWTQDASFGAANFLGDDVRLINLTARSPLGVGVIIIPWNSPLMLATWNLGPCLAAGNTCVLKPSELAPLTCLALGEIADQAGIPAGVINVIAGMGDAGAALVSHPDVDGVAFTGGVATGRSVMGAAAQSLKRVALELGGKSPNLVFADTDLKRSAAGVARSIFRSQGQSCVAGSRLLVERRIADEFISMVIEDARRLRIGDPLDEQTDYGPLITAAHRDRVDGFVKEAVREGAQVLIGGSIPDHPGRGFYYPPTILDRVGPRSYALCEEIFGPVLTVERFDEEDGAATMANAGNYGLAAYLWTSNLERALRMAQRLRTGMVWVNSFFLRDLRTPFGGARHSGLGRQGGRYSLEFWTEPKLVCMTYPEEALHG
ncbi:MAG TPA: aldehyde dehydrogenase family protein [Candidatus Binataceae bacterium]|nr:aldehyde dehydrogenase family protein [Candidatus Binataceae bacterium]